MNFLIHEVVQTSAMDCGPASLKSLLEGFDVPVSYDRLREACQTDVDGTSIDTLEQISNQMGLEAEQIMLPLDHVLLPEAHAFPAIAVVKLSNEVTHFVVLWRHHGAFVQVMDPAFGRRWIRTKTFLDDLYIHTFPVLTADWREWAESSEFIGPLKRRMNKLGILSLTQTDLITSAKSDQSWFAFASLDAAVRMVTRFVVSAGLKRGQQAEQLLKELYAHATATKESDSMIPSEYWFVAPAPLNADGETQLFLRGALLMRICGKRTGAFISPDEEESAQPLSSDFIAALKGPQQNPTRELLKLLFIDGIANPLRSGVLAMFSAFAVVFESLIFWLLINIGKQAEIPGYNFRLIAYAFGAVFLVLMLELQLTKVLLKLGSGIELKLRHLLIHKVPLLGDRYFRSRLSSDMASRSHALYKVHYFPETVGRILFAVCELLFTTIAMIWASPENSLLIVLASAFALFIPFLTYGVWADQDLRVQTHLGALSRFYLDAMIGLAPLRAHSAERALQYEYNIILRAWRNASIRLHNSKMLILGFQAILVMTCLARLLTNVLRENNAVVSVLLLAYWGLRLGGLSRDIVQNFQKYLNQRNLTQRLIEPLGVVDLDPGSTAIQDTRQNDSPQYANIIAPGVDIHLDSVHVRAMGYTILENISIKIQGGSHVAIVGPSGAGKSSLVGLLLGWHIPSTGNLFVDKHPLTSAALEKLRRETVWVDPMVQIWNRSLFENLIYGSNLKEHQALDDVIKQAALQDIINKFPQGIHEVLGESGGLVSGGEGQRVRLARGMARRPHPRLVILDEPFRGLDREQRQMLLKNSRAQWWDATLLCITHDIQETYNFDRVLVIEHGQIVESGVPAELAADSTSRYSGMLSDEKKLRQELWGGNFWRRWYLQQGRVVSAEDA